MEEVLEEAEDEAPTFSPTEICLLQEHWNLLGQQKYQTKAVTEIFLYIFQHYSHMRPLWRFGRGKVEPQKLPSDPHFRHHVINVHASLKMLINHLDKPRWLSHIVQDIGTRHFFYEAIEPHFDVVQEALMAALKKYTTTPTKSLDPELESAWKKAFDLIKVNLKIGLKESRDRYLRQAITKQEFQDIRAMWKRVEEHGLEDAGLSMCSGALRAYEALLKETDQDCTIPIHPNDENFKKFAQDTIQALDTTVSNFDQEGSSGFSNVPRLLQPYVEMYISAVVCPTLVRKAFMEGFVNMLTYVLGELSMTDTSQRTWLKLYRVMEQAITANIVNF